MYGKEGKTMARTSTKIIVEVLIVDYQKSKIIKNQRLFINVELLSENFYYNYNII